MICPRDDQPCTGTHDMACAATCLPLTDERKVTVRNKPLPPQAKLKGAAKRRAIGVEKRRLEAIANADARFDELLVSLGRKMIGGAVFFLALGVLFGWILFG